GTPTARLPTHCRSPGGRPTRHSRSLPLRLLGLWIVVVRALRDLRRDVEVLDRWRRSGLPLETFGAPGIAAGARAMAYGPGEIEHRQHVSCGQDGGTGGGEDVEELELRRILEVAARHALEAEDELREEGEIEADEDHDGGEARPALRVHPPGDLRPPEMDAGEVGHDRAADHDVMEVGDHEVRVRQIGIERERGEIEPREA